MTNSDKSILTALGALLLILSSFGGGVAGVALLMQSGDATSLRPIVLAPETIIGQAAIIYDVQNGEVLYQKNTNEPLALASLTKLMTAYSVLERESADTPVYVSAESVATEGDSGLKSGETLRLSELLKISLGASANDAMVAAAASIGVDATRAMNADAEKLGLTRSRFLNPTGLDVDETTPGAWGSAYDMARLAARFYNEHPDFFTGTTNAEVKAEAGDRTLTATPTIEPLLNMPGLIGAKTGYTDLAGGNLVVVFDASFNRPMVGVVLGSTRDGRFEDMRALIEATREQL